MPNFGSAITDPDLLRQLEGAQSPPKLGAAVDPTTAAFLDQLPGNVGAAEVKTGSPSLMTNFLYGMRQPVDQAAAMLAKAFPSQAPSVAAANQQGQQAYEQEKFPGTAGKVAEVAGNVAATAPIAYAMPGAAAPSLLARMASGTAYGTASGALQPVDPGAPDFWSQTGSNALMGAGLGAAVPAALSGASRLISPIKSPAVQSIRDMGVNLTPGQLLGGTVNRMEQGATSLPVAGDFIKSARRTATQNWNDGIINNALEPIGQKITPDLENLGDKIASMQSKWSDHFENIVPRLGVPTAEVDPVANNTLISGLNTIKADAPALARGNQLLGLVKTRIEDRLSPGGGMTGETWQEADSHLNKLANNPRNGYVHSSDPDVQQLGEAINGTRKVLMDSLVASDPAAHADLMNARASYARIVRIEDAAARAAKSKSPDVLSPSQYMAAVAAGSTKKQFAARRALGQTQARDAIDVLGDTVPDSGTPYRHALQLGTGALAAGLGGHAAGLPLMGEFSHYAPMALGAYGGLSALAGGLYSPLGRAGLSALMSRPSFAAPAAEAVRRAGPLGSVGAPWLWGSLAPSQ